MPLPILIPPIPFHRDINLVFVHFLPGATISPQLILKYFTRQLLKTQIL